MYSLYELIFISGISAILISTVVFFICIRERTKFSFFKKGDYSYKDVLGLDIGVDELLNNTSAGFFIRDPADVKRYVYFNTSAQIICGDNDGTRLDGYKSIMKMAHLSYDFLEKEDAEVLSTGKPLKLERVLYDNKGNPITWLQVTKSLIKGLDGRPLILGTLIDITQRNIKKMEMENIKLELQLALEAGGLEAWVYHHNDKTVSTFDLGDVLEKHEVFYEREKEYLSVEDYTDLRFGFTSIINGESDFHKSVFRMRYHDSTDSKYYEGRMKGIYSQQTGNLNFIIGVKKDITQEIIWQKDLESNRIKTNMAIKAAGIVIWEYDINKKIFSSHDPQSIVYIPVDYDDYFSMVHEDDIKRAKDIFKDIMEERITCGNIEIRILISGGEYRWVIIQGSVSDRDENGNPSKIIGIRRDIDNEKRLTQQLVELKDDAEKSNNLKSAYLANMSHEIRTPLNAIVGFSNLMLYTDNPVEKQEYNNIIQTSNDLLLQLISDILDLSKIEAGFLTFNFAQEDISTLFRQIEQSFSTRVKPGVAIKLNIPYEKCVIDTDRNRFIQVLSNFLTNACKFTDTGYIELGYVVISNGIKVYVRDSGVGMTEYQCERVFDRFSKFGKDVVGTGLGMAICDTIIRTFGGKIGVNSNLGQGSTFWAEIPCNPITDDIAQVKVEQPVINGNVEDKKHTKYVTERYDVLVAEDNDSNYLLVLKILENQYNLCRACDGAECVEMFISKKPDIILMDIQMPLMNGYDATMSIRKIDKNIPIIAITANAFDSDREKALAAGCNDYIAKPVNKDILNEILQKWCS